MSVGVHFDRGGDVEIPALLDFLHPHTGAHHVCRQGLAIIPIARPHAPNGMHERPGIRGGHDIALDEPPHLRVRLPGRGPRSRQGPRQAGPQGGDEELPTSERGAQTG
jgi:hypothetical protein